MVPPSPQLPPDNRAHSAVAGVPLRRQLAVALTLATAAIAAIALWDTRAEALRVSQAVSDRVLAGSAMAIAERVTPSDDRGIDVDVPFSALEMLSSTAQDVVFYRVDGPLGYLTGYADLPLNMPHGTAPVFTDLEFRGMELRATTLRRSLGTAEGTVTYAVTIAESTRARAALAEELLLRSAVRLLILIGAATTIAWMVVTLALRPVDRLGQAMGARPAGDLRPLDGRVPAEVAPLVEAVNGFMGRLSSSMEALRKFTANANHQIRTPLAVARTHLALAGRAGADGGVSLAKADAALIRAERVLAQLLLLARVDAVEGGTSLARGPVDVAALARELAIDGVPRASANGQDLGYEGPDHVMVLAERILLGEALGNLLDNALTHTAAGTVITLRVEDAGDKVTVSICDDGAGLPHAVLQGIGDSALAGAEHGLGLSIVAEIAAKFGGRLTLSRGPEGRGTEARMTLPAA